MLVIKHLDVLLLHGRCPCGCLSNLCGRAPLVEGGVYEMLVKTLLDALQLYTQCGRACLLRILKAATVV